MKKTILIILISPFLTYSQTFHEKASKTACSCIEKLELENYDKERVQPCIISSIRKTIDNEPKNSEFGKFTVEMVRFNYHEVSKILLSKCYNYNELVTKDWKKEYYAISPNSKSKQKFENGISLFKNKKYKKAISAFKKALKTDPKFVLALDYIALSYRQLEKYNEAIKYYSKSLEIFPQGDLALLNIAFCYSKKEKDELALKYYQQLVYYYPKNPEGYFGIGRINLINSNYELALRSTLNSLLRYTDTKNKKDCELLINLIYSKMEKENKLELFKKITEEFKITYIK